MTKAFEITARLCYFESVLTTTYIHFRKDPSQSDLQKTALIFVKTDFFADFFAKICDFLLKSTTFDH